MTANMRDSIESKSGEYPTYLMYVTTFIVATIVFAVVFELVAKIATKAVSSRMKQDT